MKFIILKLLQFNIITRFLRYLSPHLRAQEVFFSPTSQVIHYCCGQHGSILRQRRTPISTLGSNLNAAPQNAHANTSPVPHDIHNAQCFQKWPAQLLAFFSVLRIHLVHHRKEKCVQRRIARTWSVR